MSSFLGGPPPFPPEQAEMAAKLNAIVQGHWEFKPNRHDGSHNWYCRYPGSGHAGYTSMDEAYIQMSFNQVSLCIEKRVSVLDTYATDTDYIGTGYPKSLQHAHNYPKMLELLLEDKSAVITLYHLGAIQPVDAPTLPWKWWQLELGSALPRCGRIVQDNLPQFTWITDPSHPEFLAKENRLVFEYGDMQRRVLDLIVPGAKWRRCPPLQGVEKEED